MRISSWNRISTCHSELPGQQLPDVFAADTAAVTATLLLRHGLSKGFFPRFGKPLRTPVMRHTGQAIREDGRSAQSLLHMWGYRSVESSVTGCCRG